MEGLLRKELSVTMLKSLGRSAGCISDGQSYEIDSGRIFVKNNVDKKAKVMYDGESASLDAILSTNTVRVPKPIKVFAGPDEKGWVFVMEHLDIGGLNKYQAVVGKQLARLHLHNASLKGKGEASGYIEKFGFQCMTCCGFIPMPNNWEDNWIDFYIKRRLQPQLDMIEKEYGDLQVKELWQKLKSKIPDYFIDVHIEPSLLHGDLWSGNSGEVSDGPVIFDPASFYGHHEFDLAIAGMFGGFNKQFYDAYHKLIPKAPGFPVRHKLYTLFHYLNHWNHFGSGYRAQSIGLMRELIQ